ncbi:MAG: ribonuclease P protein component [Lysobacter sp.]
MTTTRFPRTARVRAGSDFDRIFKHGRRVALPVLALHWQTPSSEQPDTGPRGPRLGLAVSRKVDPNAVGRNRIKRVLRETFRHHRTALADGDYVVVARVGAARLSGAQVSDAFLNLLRRAGAMSADARLSLPTPAVAGTMPAPAESRSESASAPAATGDSSLAPAPSSDGD